MLLPMVVLTAGRPDIKGLSRLLKNAHLLRFSHPSSLQRTSKYASFLRISGALHRGISEQPVKIDFSATC